MITQELNEIVSTLSSSFIFSLIPTIAMIPYLVSNMLIVSIILQNQILARCILNIFPLYSKISMMVSFLVCITNFDMKMQHVGKGYVTREIAFIWQVIGGIILVGIIGIAYLLFIHGHKQLCYRVTVFTIISLCAKQYLYRNLYWGIILDSIYMKWKVQCDFRQPIKLLGAYRFSFLAEISFFLIVLTQMAMVGFSQIALNIACIFMVCSILLNLISFGFFAWSKRRADRRRNRQQIADDMIEEYPRGIAEDANRLSL